MLVDTRLTSPSTVTDRMAKPGLLGASAAVNQLGSSASSRDSGRTGGDAPFVVRAISVRRLSAQSRHRHGHGESASSVTPMVLQLHCGSNPPVLESPLSLSDRSPTTSQPSVHSFG